MSSDAWAGIGNKKTVVRVLFFILLAAAAGFFIYLQQQDSSRVESVKRLTATGTIEAKTVMASFKVPGKIETLMVDEGSAVSKGQELAILDSREIVAKVAQAQGACLAAEGLAGQAEQAVPINDQTIAAKIEQAEANLSNARQKYERARSLHDSGALSDSALDEATNNCKAAQGLLDEALASRGKVEAARQEYNATVGKKQQAQGALDEAQAALDNTHLKSPIDGYITDKMLEQGELLNAGTPVFEISDIKHSYVKLFIDEKKIGRVQLGQVAEIRVDAFPGKVFAGKVVWINDAGQFAVQKAINEQYDHDIRSFEVKIDIPNDDLRLKTGMTAMVEILEEEN